VGTLHFVKIGLMGVLGKFEASDFRTYSRDQRVICRTRRGLEWGTVVCDIGHRDSDDRQVTSDATVTSDGQLLRTTTPDDEMIVERLDRFRDRAFEACRELLAKRDLRVTLVDVEHLFDGESLFFYFLGETDSRIEAITEELAEAYDRKVRFKKFAESLSQGCGPTCGTEESSCKSSGCGSCALSGSCATR
jgi:cell fate regulator YaaT (PSP1 superfamily)